MDRYQAWSAVLAGLGSTRSTIVNMDQGYVINTGTEVDPSYQGLGSSCDQIMYHYIYYLPCYEVSTVYKVNMAPGHLGSIEHVI